MGGESVKLLVVEDETKTGDYLRQGLMEAGFVVDLVRNGLDGHHLAMTEAYDLILMDMQMPKMDGIAATLAIRQLPGYALTPIVAMTANAFAEDWASCIKAGMSDFIAKPVDPAVLDAKLYHWLNNPPASA